MKCSSLVVQALWDKASPLLQLPHVEEDMLKHFYSKRRNIKSLAQLAKMSDEDRRLLLRGLAEEQYKDLVKVLGSFPSLSMSVTTEVVDDEEQHVVTAGSIITVTIGLERQGLDTFMGRVGLTDEEDNEAEELDEEDKDMVDEEEDEKEEEKEEEKKKGPVWKKPQQKKKAGKKPGKGKQKSKQKLKAVETVAGTTATSEVKEQESGSESEAEESGSEDSGSEKGGSERGPASPASEGDEEQEDQEWARFQRGVNKREKALSGKSRVSHSVHCPYFTDDKQEYWWVYICDRKTHSLITPPYHLTNLVNNEEVELKFTAPGKPGHYNFTVCVRSDSYLGVDLMDDIRLDVQEAREAPTAHPQWEFEDESGDDEGKEASEESEYATDDDYEDESD